MKVRIYYHDTDCGGVVYYANYLRYFEEARTEFFEQRGIFIKKLAEDGTVFVVARQEADYKAPAYYGDILEIGTRLANISKVRIELDCEVKNQDGKIICLAKTTLACVGSDLKPKALPEEARKALLEGSRG